MTAVIIFICIWPLRVSETCRHPRNRKNVQNVSLFRLQKPQITCTRISWEVWRCSFGDMQLDRRTDIQTLQYFDPCRGWSKNTDVDHWRTASRRRVVSLHKGALQSIVDAGHGAAASVAEVSPLKATWRRKSHGTAGVGYRSVLRGKQIHILRPPGRVRRTVPRRVSWAHFCYRGGRRDLRQYCRIAVCTSKHWRFDIQGGPKNVALFLYAVTLSNINQFLQLFHCQNQEQICNNTITKDPITPQVCCYTALWNVTEWGKLSQRFTEQWHDCCKLFMILTVK